MKALGPCSAMLTIVSICSSFSNEAHAAGSPSSVTGVTPGRWASNDNVSTTASATAGSKFFLDVVLSKDGTFRGSWEQYVCFNYPGAYGINILACQRSQEAAAASGRFDLSSQAGQIELEGLGQTPFRFKLTSDSKGQAQLDIELPRDWLKQGAPILYATSLNPR